MEMVFDRTAADVEEARKIRDDKIKTFSELTEKEKGILEKGFLGINALNRIEEGLRNAKERIAEIGYHNIGFESKQWNGGEFFGADDFERIISNINLARNGFLVKKNTPKTPNALYRYDLLNDIEKIINDFFEVIDDITENYRQCGAYECGEG